MSRDHQSSPIDKRCNVSESLGIHIPFSVGPFRTKLVQLRADRLVNLSRGVVQKNVDLEKFASPVEAFAHTPSDLLRLHKIQRPLYLFAAYGDLNPADSLVVRPRIPLVFIKPSFGGGV